MKYLLTMLLGFFILNANTTDLTPLNKYLEKHNVKKDLTAAYYFSSRCVAIYAYSAGLMKTPSMKDLAAMFELYAAMHYSIAETASTAFGDNKEVAEKKHSKLLTQMNEKYIELGNENYVAKGEYMTDTHLQDIKVCSDYIKNLDKE